MATSSKLITGKTAGIAQAREVLVEIDDKPAVAKVVREGFQVPSIKLNTQRAEFFLGNLDVIQPRLTPRVVSQSIKDGTKVSVGTIVDLVLAPPTAIPFDIFDNVHRDLRQRSVSTLIDGILQDPTTRQSLLKYDKAQDVPAAEKTALTAQFQAANIGIDDNVPEASFEAAFNSARGALAFK
jgi:hypothetical protein